MFRADINQEMEQKFRQRLRDLRVKEAEMVKDKERLQVLAQSGLPS